MLCVLQPAKYFSTGTYEDASDWRHYALAAPMYTHFTSPIRRYPDIVVHRLLARLLATDPSAAKRKFSANPLKVLDSNPDDSASASGMTLDFTAIHEIIPAC